MAFLTRTGAYANAPEPDLVILDLNLPGQSGIDILRRVRGNASLQDLKVVVFSASNRSEDREEALSAGADEYFTKAPDLNDFIATVEEICSRVPSGPVLKSA
jgi:DNA-binding response OmpR family regulator